MKRFLGIDTSCYTTSAAVLNEQGGLERDERIVLSVKPGHRGLSQSEMLYQHIRNLPVLFERCGRGFGHSLAAVGVSAFPRRRRDSYMPAFLAGRGTAEILSAAEGIPLFLFSHQENHAMAALRENPSLWGRDFYMLHLSGGTNDFLHVSWPAGHMKMEELCSSSDISAGQYIDRIGVALGLPFPAGPALEELAEQADGRVYKVPVPHGLSGFSFAGPESQVRRDMASGNFTPSQIAFGVISSVGRALEEVFRRMPLEKGLPLIAAGGVTENRYLRRVLAGLAGEYGLTPLFPPSGCSRDNATGNAFGAFMVTGGGS